MTQNEAKVGIRVKSLVDFTGVPAGTGGVIDEDYGSGVMVKWDLRGEYLRDGFDKYSELSLLEVVRR